MHFDQNAFKGQLITSNNWHAPKNAKNFLFEVYLLINITLFA